MISIELACKLKETGLEWKASIGDYYYSQEKDVTDIIPWPDVYPLPEFVWMPYLHQLLAEITKRGYGWNLDQADKEYRKDKFRVYLYKGEDFVDYFDADTPEDAAARALLWILEKERGE